MTQPTTLRVTLPGRQKQPVLLGQWRSHCTGPGRASTHHCPAHLGLSFPSAYHVPPHRTLAVCKVGSLAEACSTLVWSISLS